jgi:hypothetical protein
MTKKEDFETQGFSKMSLWYCSVQGATVLQFLFSPNGQLNWKNQKTTKKFETGIKTVSEEKIHYSALYGITVNGIIRLMLSYLFDLHRPKEIIYFKLCLVIVINLRSLHWSQKDPVKQLPLYLVLKSVIVVIGIQNFFHKKIDLN